LSDHLKYIKAKIHSWDSLETQVRTWREQGLKIVFTNGCFDLLHRGHIHYLHEAADLGDKLIIAVNSSASVQKLKGEHRPLQDEDARCEILAALSCVDAVVVFNEDTPLEILKVLMPNVLVKGGDYTIDKIVGADLILEKGGEVAVLSFLPGYSTSAIEAKIKNQIG
jgi:rfaE bifunctional protein nucleotidyltransferase chain/domain